MAADGLFMLRMNLRVVNNMSKSILSALYSSGRYIVLLILFVAAVWVSEVYYDAHVVVMAFTLE